MTLPNPKELRALLKVCREFGVDAVEFGDVKLNFGQMPTAPGEAPKDGMQISMPSDEDMAYWSTQPDPLAQRVEQQ